MQIHPSLGFKYFTVYVGLAIWKITIEAQIMDEQIVA